MIDRCTNPNATSWYRYGARGITICEEWRHSFSAFLSDMGERPHGKTLDRINNDGNYEPGNCRWATPSEQRANSTGGRRPRAGEAGKPVTIRATDAERAAWERAAEAEGCATLSAAIVKVMNEWAERNARRGGR